MAGGRGNGREQTAEHELPVRPRRQREHRAVRRRRERPVDAAVGMHARDARMGLPAHSGEHASRHDTAVGLRGERQDRAVRIRIEGRIRAAVRVHARDAVVCLCADRGETAADDETAVGLAQEREHRVVGVRIERLVDAAVGIQAGEMIADVAADLGEAPAHDQLSIGLHDDCVDLAVRIRVECTVQCAVGVESDDAVAHARTDLGERTRDDEASIRLCDDGLDGVVDRRDEEGRVEIAVDRQSSEPATGLSAENREVAADEDLSIRLHRERLYGRIRIRIESVDRILRSARRRCAGEHRCREQDAACRFDDRPPFADVGLHAQFLDGMTVEAASRSGMRGRDSCIAQRQRILRSPPRGALDLDQWRGRGAQG